MKRFQPGAGPAPIAARQVVVPEQWISPALTRWVLLWLALFLAPDLAGQERRFTFEHFTVNEGLSQNLISSILQDRSGFLWLGTKDGLNKYDGYGFSTYHRLPFDSGSLSDGYITRLFEDSKGRLWIGTFRGGLNLYDRESGSFRHIPTAAAGPLHPEGEQITAIEEDRDGSLWIGSYTSGLSRLSAAESSTQGPGISVGNQGETKFGLAGFVLDPRQPQATIPVLSLKVDSLGSLWIGTTYGLYLLENAASAAAAPMNGESGSGTPKRSPAPPPAFLKQSLYPPEPLLGVGAIYEDRNRRLWLGTPKGLFRFDRSRRSFLHFPYSTPQLAAAMGSIAVICEFAPGPSNPPTELWLGTYGGVAIFDLETQSFRYLRHNPVDPQSLSAGRILSLYQDRSGVMWLGSNGNGLNKYDPLSARFPYPDYANVDASITPGTIRSLSVRSFYQNPDRGGHILWIGSSEALFRVDRKARSFERISNRGRGYPDFGAVYSMLQDEQGLLWIGGGQGLFAYDPDSRRILHFKPGLLQEDGAEDNRVFKLVQDEDGSLWAVTARTFARFDRGSRTFTHHRYRQDPPNRFEQPIFPSVYKDAAGKWWLGTETGLHCYSAENGQFKQYAYDPANRAGLNSDVVRAVEPDPRQPGRYLWLGTAGGGLNRLDLATETFTHYTQADGLANNFVYGILSDGQGALWISTNGGLSRLDPQSMTFRNYDVGDGLQGNEFNSGAYFKSSSGELFFGGISGYNTFFPADIRDNSHVPAIAITSVHVSSPSAEPQKRTLYLKSLPSQTEEIRLSHLDKILSFEFAALSFSMPQRNLYAYRLEGLENNWRRAARDRRATFTYLPPGEYTFRVKGSNNDGVWNNEGTALRVVILPPVWRTWWAYGLYALILLSLLYGLRRYELNRLLLKHNLELLEEDVRLAASIQQSLMPKEYPQIPGYAIAAKTIPCRKVGGDYHDCIPVGGQRVSISIADAAGKAMPAALLMANLQALIRSQSLAASSVKECVDIANSVLFQNTESHSFVTLFHSILDGETHRLRFCNAGHNYPLMFSPQSQPRELKAGGMIVGVFAEARYEESEVEFQAGDLLVLYSDGITEAVNASDEEFGTERLIALAEKNRDQPPGRLIELILEEVRRHMGGLPQSDDMSLVIVKRED